MESAGDFGHWAGLCCGGVPVFLGNIFPGRGGVSLPSPSPVLPLVDEVNPLVGLPVDDGNGVGRELVERGCNVDMEFRDGLRVMGVEGGLSLPSLLPALPPVDERNPPVGLHADNSNEAGRDSVENDGDLDIGFRGFQVMGARDG